MSHWLGTETLKALPETKRGNAFVTAEEGLAFSEVSAEERYQSRLEHSAPVWRLFRHGLKCKPHVSYPKVL